MLNVNRKGSYKRIIPGLLGGHMLSIIVGMFISSLLGRFQNSIIVFAMYALCVGFAFFFSYHEGWVAGASDKLYIENSQLEYNPWKGVVAGAAASVVNLIVAIVGVLSEITALGNIKVMSQGVFEIFYRIWFWAYNVIFSVIDIYPVFYFLPVLMMPAACGIGYVFGVKHFHLLEYLVYKKDNK